MIIWNKYISKYQTTLNEVVSKITKIQENLYNQFGYSPIEKISSRIKTESSAQKKLLKKNLEFNEKNLDKISDIAGVRIICKFVDDIPEILQLIASWQDVKVIKEKNFIDEPKPSGYRSYHIVCSKNNVIFEIQLRTMAMDFWATNEHMLKYKYGGEIPKKLASELLKISKTAQTLDFKMNNIRKEIKIGTVASRIIEQIFQSVHTLEEIGLHDKASFYRKQLIKNGNDLDALRRIAIRAKEDVPKQYWK
ncbi:GTP pyrophosphokinase family protein [Candidatus Woesearchaeota archaeon]|nr:GTP pyrophosphokinase family protein [Candidatus Woesearchaeota archaeon]